jgi:hypothetical protein
MLQDSWLAPLTYIFNYDHRGPMQTYIKPVCKNCTGLQALNVSRSQENKTVLYSSIEHRWQGSLNSANFFILPLRSWKSKW